MKRSFRRLVFLGAFAFIASLLFQNCGPAHLKGGALPNSSLSSNSIVGSKVNLEALLQSPQEPEANVLFPSLRDINDFDYAQNAPVIENIVLLNNDFSKIEWVHGPTSTVVAAGDAFNQVSFSPNLLGVYYVFGYRGESPFLLAKFRLIEKGTTTLGVNSAQAVTLNQKSIPSDGVNERVLVSVEAPAVDLSSIQIISKKDGSTISGRRAALISKKLSETLDVEFRLADVQGQALVKNLNLTAKTTSPTTSSPTPVQPPPAPASPTIASGPTVDNLSAREAQVTWSLSEPATGQIQYGTTTSYGSFSALESSFNYSTHTMRISGLTPGTTYHYRVISKNAQGGQVISTDKTFTTLLENSIMQMPTTPLTVKRGASFTATITVNSAVSPVNENLMGFVNVVTRSSTPASFAMDFNPNPATTSWNGSTVTYNVPVTVPANLPLGEYTVRVGFRLNRSPYTRMTFNPGPNVIDDTLQRYVIAIITVQ